jgi:hypothetical protein
VQLPDLLFLFSPSYVPFVPKGGVSVALEIVCGERFRLALFIERFYLISEAKNGFLVFIKQNVGNLALIRHKLDVIGRMDHFPIDAVIAADYFNARKLLISYHEEAAARKHLHRFTVNSVIFRNGFEQIQSRCAYGSRTLINTVAYTGGHVTVEANILLLVNSLKPS